MPRTLFFLLIFTLLWIALPAQGQGSCITVINLDDPLPDANGVYIRDDITGEFAGYANVQDVGYSGLSLWGQPKTGYASLIFVEVVFPEGVTFESIVFDKYHAGSGLTATNVYYRNLDGSLVQNLGRVDYGGTGWSADLSRTLSGSAPVRVIAFMFNGTGVGSQSGLDNIRIAHSCLTIPTPEYTIPLFTNDRDFFNTSNSLYQNVNGNLSALAFSYKDNAPVHAAIDGTVTNIYRARPEDCTTYLGDINILGSLFGQQCLFEDPGGDAWVFDGIDSSLVYQNTYIQASVVTVSSATDNLEFVYFVNNTEQFVSVGDSIAAGCVLGTTVGLQDTDRSLATVSAYQAGTPFDPIPEMTLEPLVDAPACGASGETSQFDTTQCLNQDPTLTDIGVWTSSNLDYVDPGVILNPDTFGDGSGGSIRQILNLDLTREPQVIISAKAIGADSLFTISVGDTVQEFSLSQYTDYFQVLTFSAPSAQPDVGDFHTVKIHNLSFNAWVALNFVCVRHALDTGGLPVDPPLVDSQTCTFLNYSFSDGDTNWSFSGGYDAPPGEIRITTSNFSQSITLAAGNYRVMADIGILHDGTYTYSGQSGDVTLQMDWDTVSLAVGTASYQALSYTNEAQLENTFTVAADNTATATFTYVLYLPPSGVTGIIVRSVCIVQDTPGIQIVSEKCQVIATPTDNNVSSWTYWLWKNQNQFFQCDLMKMLNKIYAFMVKSFQTWGYTVRWSMALTDLGIRWMASDLLPWMAGYWSNIEPGTIIVEGSSECNSIWCLGKTLIDGFNNAIDRLFDSLDFVLRDIIKPLIDLIIDIINLALRMLLDVLNAIIDLIFLLIGEIVKLFLFARDLLIALIAAWNNSTPQAIPGIWDCVNDTTPHAVCWILWMLENTLFGGVTGGLIIPLVVSLGYILVTIQYVKRSLKAIQEMGQGV